MCNKIQQTNYKKLKSEGYGYKMVEKKRIHYHPIVDEDVTYKLGTFYKWNHGKHRPFFLEKKIEEDDYGFCFFLSLKDARSARTSWKANGRNPLTILLKIRYTKGMASFTSETFDGKPRRFALTKEFVVLKEVK